MQYLAVDTNVLPWEDFLSNIAIDNDMFAFNFNDIMGDPIFCRVGGETES